ncbi:MAG: flagellar FliJ family protein [Phycisphaeraceae bacterium]|nr:flagellar FliJ family protein [Phycisphaerae bacterium]MBX3392893.1 flagellar FliJ family protein [Phycisphaeraceae bacterium]
MARFVFRLQAVLEQRRAKERAMQIEVARIERERIEAEGEIRAHQRAIERERDALRRMLDDQKDAVAAGAEPDAAGMVDIRGVRMQAAAAVRLTAVAQRAAVRLAGIHRRLDSARLDLLQAATRRKAVELLREKRLAEHKAGERSRDAAMTDEMATMRPGPAGLGFEDREYP